MPAGRVGEWVAAFYQLVDAAAAAHGVTRVESRGDCCVCVTGAAGAVPAAHGAAACAAADGAEDQATRMLAFAAALHARVAALPVGGRRADQTFAASTAGTAVRMGMATGEASFLAIDGGGGAAPSVSVTGAAAAVAARMEALAAPGLARVHRSTADKWAAEAGRAPPATALVVGAVGAAAERAAEFDCAAGAFCAGEDARGPGCCGGPDRLRRRRPSAPF
jgi:class 3 adenylate cyclase